MNFIIFSYERNNHNFLWFILFIYYLLCRREVKHFDVHFRRMSEDGKHATYGGRNRWRGVHFPPESAFFLFRYYDWNAFPHLYFELWLAMQTTMFLAKEKVWIRKTKILLLLEYLITTLVLLKWYFPLFIHFNCCYFRNHFLLKEES